jgi:hypothetical protein
MKKILILGGASVHCKLVETAKAMGYYTIVTDYLTDSPAKKIADESWMLNITDIDAIVEKCRSEHIESVISGWLDPCQRPYYEICKKLGVPCYGTWEQFYKMTDKHAFKKMCIEYGVDVIPEYDENNLDAVEYPVFVKPVDSRGSRGQTVCYDAASLIKAIAYAKSESSNGDILIEKYVKDGEEFQVTYFFVDGEPYLLRTVDSYCGSEENHLEKVVACAISPSKHTDYYLKTAHNKVVNMFKQLGIKNGPVFMQGFVDHGVFRFFDPGLRFPGVAFTACHENYRDAVQGADIIITAISGQEPILKADWIKEGAFYSHVGGYEDEFAVAEKADKIVCDDWNAVKHRTQTVSRMFKQGLLQDSDIHANLYEIVAGQKPGREHDEEFIYYNGVGMSYVDVALANWMYKKAKKQGYG